MGRCVCARAVASDLERTGCAKGESTASCGCMRGVGSVRREARGRAKGREKAARRRPIKVQRNDKPSHPTQKNARKKRKARTPSGILCCSAALGGWAGEREREKDEGGKGRRRAGRAPSTRPQSMRGGRRGGRHRCPSPLIKLPRLPPV